MSIEPPDKQSDKLRRSEMLCTSTPNISPLRGLRFLGEGFYKHVAPMELGTESMRFDGKTEIFAQNWQSEYSGFVLDGGPFSVFRLERERRFMPFDWAELTMSSQPRRGEIFIDMAMIDPKLHRSGIKRDMPPRWGSLSFSIVCYKDIAPTELSRKYAVRRAGDLARSSVHRAATPVFPEAPGFTVWGIALRAGELGEDQRHSGGQRAADGGVRAPIE
jgi:hypothetical protein